MVVFVKSGGGINGGFSVVTGFCDRENRGTRRDEVNAVFSVVTGFCGFWFSPSQGF